MINKIIQIFFQRLGRKGIAILLLNIILMLLSSFLMSQTPIAFQKFITSAKENINSNQVYLSLIVCALFYFSSSLLRDLQLYTFTFVERIVTLNIGSQTFLASLGNPNGNPANFNTFLISFQAFISLIFFTVVPVLLDLIFIVFSFNFGFSFSVTSIFITYLIGYWVLSILSTTYIGRFQKVFFKMQAQAFNKMTSLFSCSDLFVRNKALRFAKEIYLRNFSENQSLRVSIGAKRSMQANLINLWTATFFVLIFFFAIKEIQNKNGAFETLIPIEAFFFQSLRRLEIFVRSFRDTVNNYANLSNFSDWIDRTIASYKSINNNQKLAANQIPLIDVSPGLTLINGPTGTGKSTLLNQLFEYHKNNLNCTYVKQTEEFFESSVLENVTLGANIDADNLTKLFEDLNLTQVIQRLPQGLQTQIDKSNPMLSGGELQRLSLARALAVHPNLIFLDEVTSAQDGLKEEEIFKLLKEKSKSVPVFMVSHSQFAVKYADRIIQYIKQGHFEIKEGVSYDKLTFSGV